MLPVRRTTLAFVSTTCTARNFSRNLSKSSRSMDRRFVDHGERACSTSGQSECGLVSIWSVLTSGEAIWSRSDDGLSWSFDGEVETRGGGGYSRRGIGIDKCHAALISLSVSSPALTFGVGRQVLTRSWTST